MKRLNNGFYQSHAWKRCRAAYIAAAGGVCERCKAMGILNAGRVVHHKVELTPQNYTDPAIAYGFDNLMLVCQECHEQIHKGVKPYRWTTDGKLIEKR